MDRNLYNQINADVIRNKEIQKATGISPATEKQALGKEVIFKPTIEGWRTGWRIRITRDVLEDFAGYSLNLPSFYMKGRYDFNCAVSYFYPFPIALATAFRIWAWYKVYDVIKALTSFQWKERRIKNDLDAAYKKGYVAGREFEFKTQHAHDNVMGKLK